MANKIDLIVKYSTEAWDKVYAQESRSSLLDGNKKLLKFEGAKTVKIAKFSASGLSNYGRANTPRAGNYAAGDADTFNAGTGYGYKTADMALTWETFTMECDRAAQYRIDLMDNEETDAMAVGTCTTEVSRTIMIPEIDAYCFSKLATDYAGKTDTADIVYEGTPSTGQKKPIDALNDALLFFDEHEVAPENQIIFCSPKFAKALRSTNELYKRLDQSEYKKNVSFLIEEYEGRPVIVVAPNRFKTNIVLADEGFTFGSGAKDINFMVVAKDAVYHVVKYNKVRVFAPEVVQDYDGYKVNARVYHDVFVPDNKRVAVYVSVVGDSHAAAGLAVGAELTANVTAGSTDCVVNDVRVIPSTTFIAGLKYKLLSSGTGTAPAAGVALGEGYTNLTIGTAITLSDATHIEIVAIDAGGRVIGSNVYVAKAA